MLLYTVLGNKQSQKLIDNILVLFNSTYEQLEGESLRHLMVSTLKMHTISHYALFYIFQITHLKEIQSLKIQSGIKIEA